MKKKTLLITLLFLCIFSLVGCTKKREAEDPKEYWQLNRNEDKSEIIKKQKKRKYI